MRGQDVFRLGWVGDANRLAVAARFLIQAVAATLAPASAERTPCKAVIDLGVKW